MILSTIVAATCKVVLYGMATVLLVIPTTFVTMDLLNPKKVIEHTNSNFVEKGAFIDFGTPERPAKFYGVYSDDPTDGFEYYKYEKELSSFNNQPNRINKKTQMFDSSFHGTMDRPTFNSTPKKAYGKWFISQEYYIENEPTKKFFVGPGMEQIQLKQYKDEVHYETMVAPLFMIKDYIQYE